MESVDLGQEEGTKKPGKNEAEKTDEEINPNQVQEREHFLDRQQKSEDVPYEHHPGARDAVLWDRWVRTRRSRKTLMTNFRNLDSVASSQLILDKTCLNDFGFPTDVCDDLVHFPPNNTVVQVMVTITRHSYTS